MVIEPSVVGVRGLQLRRGRCRPRLRCGGVLGEISLVSHSIPLRLLWLEACIVLAGSAGLAAFYQIIAQHANYLLLIAADISKHACSTPVRPPKTLASVGAGAAPTII